MIKQAITLLALGAINLGCNQDHSKAPPPGIAAVVTQALPSPVVIPPEPVEGYLIAQHWAAHPDYKGTKVFPPEPYAAHGSFQKTPLGTPVWVPDWLSGSSLYFRALQEIDVTLPRQELDGQVVPSILPGPQAEHPFRVVVMNPWSFPINGGDRGLYAGVLCPKSWLESDGKTLSDVAFVAFRANGFKYTGPPELNNDPLLPAWGHEFRRIVLMDYTP